MAPLPVWPAAWKITSAPVGVHLLRHGLALGGVAEALGQREVILDLLAELLGAVAHAGLIAVFEAVHDGALHAEQEADMVRLGLVGGDVADQEGGLLRLELHADGVRVLAVLKDVVDERVALVGVALGGRGSASFIRKPMPQTMSGASSVTLARLGA